MERNPVAANLARNAWLWPWSSAAAHCGLGQSPLSLETKLWKERFAPAAWREALERGLADAAFAQRLREATRRGRPLGSAVFIHETEHALGRILRPQKRGPKPHQNAAIARRQTA